MTYTKLFQPLSRRIGRTLSAAFLLAVPGFSPSIAGVPGTPPVAGEMAESTAPLADERASYSFLRTLEGSATVAANGEGIGETMELNQPLLTSDLVRVGPESRLQLALSDRNRLYIDADSAVVLERLAFSGDREERVTVLRLEGGELFLEVADEALGDELPRVVTANATVYIQQPGQYRVEAGIEDNGEAWTRVVTRRGFAEIVTDRGSSVVREDEAILAVGERGTRLDLAAADVPDELERWGGVLGDRALAASRSSRYVEPHLAYDAAPLDQAGDWVEYESVNYWRPYVSAGWRPYWQGRWAWTPSGYTWVSNEPWGWVPYHYGRWCSLPGLGWAWRPGALYSPAWVYWNWTSGWAGWVPMGYYSQFYDPWYGGGYRYGVYGWAGGGWGIYSDWNYAPVHCFRDRRFGGHMRRGRDMEHESGHREPPRGLLTTDTRDFRPERLDRTDRTEDLLHQIGKRNRQNTGQELPDVTDFVGRKGKLPTDIAKVIVPDDGKGRGRIQDIGRQPKVAETPTWKRREEPKLGSIDRSPGAKVPPVQSTEKDVKRVGGPSGGVARDKPGSVTPTNVPRADLRVPGEKGRSPQTLAREPETKVYGTKGAPGDAANRQLWKEKGGESVPVQRVVGSVRRPAPGSESTPPAAPGKYGIADGAKSTGRSEPAQPSQRYGNSSPAAPASKPSESYGKGSSGSQGSQGSPSYGKGSSGSQGSQGSPSYGRGSSGSQGSQGSPSYGRGSSSSQGSQRSPSYGRSSSGSQGSPSYGKGSSGSQGSQGSPSYGKGSSGSQGSQGSPSYGKGSSGSQGSQGSPSYGKGSSGSQGSQGSPSYGRSSSGSQGSQGSPSYGKGSSGSQGSQRSQPAAKSGSGGSSASGSKNHKSSPPPPPPTKKEDDGH